MLFALFLAMQAASPEMSSATEGDTVVVRGTPTTLGDAFERCRKGGCPARQDIVASIGYAEVVFRSGRYRDARQLLQGAIARNKHAAGTEPIAVAALYEATATVALHDGEQDVARHASAARVQVLRDKFGPSHWRLLQAELDAADLKLRWNRVEEAVTTFRSVANRAAAAGLPMIVASAMMRQALVAHADRHERYATALLERLVGDKEQALANRLAARALLARFARERGDKGATDRLVASFLDVGNTGVPILLWQPPLPKPLPAQLSWADIGFLIRPDGTVETPEILRGSPKQGWSRPVLATIAARRYAPMRVPAAQLYRIERWTIAADYMIPSGSLILRPVGTSRYAQVDLSQAEPNSAQQSKADSAVPR